MLTTLKGKLQELSEADQTMAGILDDAKRASRKGDLTAEQRGEFDIASDEFDNIIENLTAEERIEFAEMQLENAKGRRSAHDTGKTFSPCKQSELMKKNHCRRSGKNRSIRHPRICRRNFACLRFGAIWQSIQGLVPRAHQFGRQPLEQLR